MRKVYYAPITHRFRDEGLSGLRGMIKRRNMDVKALDEFNSSHYGSLEMKTSRLKGRVDKVYRDSMIYGHDEHVKMLNGSSKPLSKLVKGFADEGARLMKTESAPLMCTVYAIADLLKKVRSKRKKNRLWEMKAEYNVLRDKYVARRIDLTLREGEEAMLFMGAAHDIQFDKSITVEYLYTPAYVHREQKKAANFVSKFG